MEMQATNKETQVACVKTCKETCKSSCKDTCKEPYILTQEDMKTMKKLTYQLKKLNDSLEKFESMAANGGLLSSFLPTV